jgi:hypothetical protein
VLLVSVQDFALETPLDAEIRYSIVVFLLFRIKYDDAKLSITQYFDHRGKLGRISFISKSLSGAKPQAGTDWSAAYSIPSTGVLSQRGQDELEDWGDRWKSMIGDMETSQSAKLAEVRLISRHVSQHSGSLV